MLQDMFMNMSETYFDELRKSLVDTGSFDLNKGLDIAGTGSVTDYSDFEGGRTVMVENIENFFHDLMEDKSEFPLAAMIPKSNMEGVYDRFARRTGFGANPGKRNYGTFVSEKGMPTERNPSLASDFGIAKFIRDMRTSSHVFDVSKKRISAQVINDADAASLALSSLHKCLIYGNSSVIPYEFDGLVQLLSNANTSSDTIAKYNLKTNTVIDMRNAELDETAITLGLQNIRKNWGMATHMHVSFDLMSYLNTEVLRNTIRTTGVKTEKGYFHGTPVEGYRSPWAQGGKLLYVSDRHIQSGNGEFSMAPDGAFGISPSIAASAAITTAVASDSASKFVATDAGTYFYRIVALTADGSSAPVTTDGVASVSVASGEKVTITIEAPASGSLPTGYEVYRSAKNAVSDADCRSIGTVAASPSTGAATFVDYNDIIPGTGIALILDLNENQAKRSFVYRRLLPFFKLPLPFSSNGVFGRVDSYGLYGYLQAPKMSGVLIRNIKIPGCGFSE